MGRVIFDTRHLHELDSFVQKKTGDRDAEWWKNIDLIPKSNVHYQAILQFREDLKRRKIELKEQKRKSLREARVKEKIKHECEEKTAKKSLKTRKILQREKSVWVVTDTKTGEVMKFDSANEIAEYFNCHPSTVRTAKHHKYRLKRRYVLSTEKEIVEIEKEIFVRKYKSWIVIDSFTGKEYVFKTSQEAADFTGVSDSTLRKANLISNGMVGERYYIDTTV